MESFVIKNEFYDAIKNGDIQVIKNGFEEVTNRLIETWKSSNSSVEFKETMKACGTRAKWAVAEMNESKTTDREVIYYVSKLEGVVDVFSKLYQLMVDSESIEAAIPRRGGKSMEVLGILYDLPKYEEIDNKALLERANVSAQNMSNIMKRLILAGAVSSIRCGRSVRYRLTDAGHRYYEKNNLLKSNAQDDDEEKVQKRLEKIEKSMLAISENMEKILNGMDALSKSKNLLVVTNNSNQLDSRIKPNYLGWRQLINEG